MKERKRQVNPPFGVTVSRSPTSTVSLGDRQPITGIDRQPLAPRGAHPNPSGVTVSRSPTSTIRGSRSAGG